MPTPIESMRIVAERLVPLKVPFVFVGGAVMPLLVDYPELTEIRPTKDIDVVVQIVTYQQLSVLEERLRLAGFRHDTSEGAPICRWTIENCLVDVMPMDSRALGMNCRWFPEALDTAQLAHLGNNCMANVINALLFLATKLEAFKDRGKGDYYGCHDLEDIITLVDGRANIVEEVSGGPDAVRNFVKEGFRQLLENQDFHDAFTGHLSGLTGARERAPLVMERFLAIVRQK
jgi:predicted nucleotidyltransferase